jgi:hypothetical protein
MKYGRKASLIAVAAAMLVLSGCSPKESAEPVAAQDYPKLLTEVDTSLQAPFAALAKDDKAAFASATQSLRAGADKFDATGAPEAVQAQQDSLATSLRELSDVVEKAGTEKAACPAGSPAAGVLTSDEAEQVRAKAKDLTAADAAYTFGSFLPAAPAEQKRQLKTGAFIKKGGTGGIGELEIKNGAGDTTVSLVGKDPKKPVFTVYVRGKGKYTVKGIKTGTYQVFTASGVDWDAKKKGFTRDCGFSKFEDKFKFESAGTRWTITLEQVVGGNADTSDVDPSEFPAG